MTIKLIAVIYGETIHFWWLFRYDRWSTYKFGGCHFLDRAMLEQLAHITCHELLLLRRMGILLGAHRREVSLHIYLQSFIVGGRTGMNF